VNVPQEQLDTLRTLAVRLKQSVWSARCEAGPTRDALLTEAGHLAANLETRLDRVGAQSPAAVPPPAGDVPLRLMDTPANRRYAEALRVAWEAGLAVDRERYGEAIGTDGAAQVVEMVLADVEAELHGPAGARRE
jgi:hypothetical protein